MDNLLTTQHAILKLNIVRKEIEEASSDSSVKDLIELEQESTGHRKQD